MAVFKSTSLWGRELKDHDSSRQGLSPWSTSLWGRELKVLYRIELIPSLAVDLLVRSWIERLMILTALQKTQSTSLWGRELKDHDPDVPWEPDGSTSLWGRELKVETGLLAVFLGHVDLLVRSWIERFKKPLLSYWPKVDLLVRSWIERQHRPYQKCSTASTSLWGRELKELSNGLLHGIHRRPPCEVVNWKFPTKKSLLSPSRSTSLWGRELKGFPWIWRKWRKSRPPCEVVNWKTESYLKDKVESMSTSLWGRELKGFNSVEYTGNWSRPPCEVQLRKRYS